MAPLGSEHAMLAFRFSRMGWLCLVQSVRFRDVVQAPPRARSL